MAEAAKPSVDKDKNKDKLDKKKLREQLSEWHSQVVRSFPNEDEREREELLNELEDSMPARLSEVKECLRMFLENGSDFVDTYNLFLQADDMTLGIKNASNGDGIDADQLHRLKKLLEQLKALHLLECGQSISFTFYELGLRKYLVAFFSMTFYEKQHLKQ
ncbi:uncharacterized protein LOC110457675 [Mizuhopecten yessoensis]|uniref:uncharacterized protein LOC110457675 n=1 Tax=Mizuhopecten yessoensis TaxID=6573 RepID=UPI000B458372|nr:uncharacterized protein LOC110457675 [Mizuhopecten yessoensis]